jgi:zinc protease
MLTYKTYAPLARLAFLVSGIAITILFFTNAHAASQPPISDFTLDNGLRVIVIEDQRVPAVSHNLMVKLGAADDPRGKSGLAHYLEHMMFQGTAKLKPNEYSQRIADKGGKSNAFTSADYTGYWVNIAKDQLPLVMELEAERMAGLQPPEKDFEREKQVILEERRMRVDNSPVALFAEQLQAALYLHHPYGTPIIGWPEEMRALNRDDVMEYHRRFYHPSNMLLVLSGDIAVEEARDLVERYYAPIADEGENVPPRVEEPQQLAPRRVTMRHAQIQQAQWNVTYLVPSFGWKRDDAQILPMMVAEYVLGGSKTSRLYRRLVEREKLASEVYVSHNPYAQGPGEFSIDVTPLKVENIPAIEKAVQEELAMLKTQPPSEDELARAKTQLIASSIYAQDGLQLMAKIVAHLVLNGLPPDYYYEWPELIKKIKGNAVSASLKALDADWSVTGELLPK